MDLNNFKYAHIGNNHISYEEWKNINNTLYSNKPLGGLWTCPFNNIGGSISDWTDFLLENPDMQNIFIHTSACLINLNEQSNICHITNNNIEEIINIYGYKNKLDFESLEKVYDALYVNPYSINSKYRKTIFKNWDVRTLLIFNPNIIKEYIPIEITIKNKGFYIKNYGEKQTLKSKQKILEKI